MKRSDLKSLFAEAEEDLRQAKNELYRPMEDVVGFSACVFSRRALYKYLRGLSLINAEENEDNLEEGASLENLIDYNSKYDVGLNNIDFSMLSCKCHEISEEGEEEEDLVYCTGVQKLNYCSNLSESVRRILVEKRPSLVNG